MLFFSWFSCCYCCFPSFVVFPVVVVAVNYIVIAVACSTYLFSHSSWGMTKPVFESTWGKQAMTSSLKSDESNPCSMNNPSCSGSISPEIERGGRPFGDQRQASTRKFVGQIDHISVLHRKFCNSQIHMVDNGLISSFAIKGNQQQLCNEPQSHIHI